MRNKDIYTVYIENKTAHEAKELAQRLGMSFSKFVEKALKSYMEKMKKGGKQHDRKSNG